MNQLRINSNYINHYLTYNLPIKNEQLILALIEKHQMFYYYLKIFLFGKSDCFS